jgi:hypothetical protein
MAYMLTLLLVYVLAALWPVAIFFLVFFFGHLLGVAVAILLMLATIMIYSLFWTGFGHRSPVDPSLR